MWRSAGKRACKNIMKNSILEIAAFLSIIVGIFTGEYFLKNYIEDHETFDTDRPILFGLAHLRKYHNYGAALDSGSKKPALIRALSMALTMGATIVFIFTMGQKGVGMLKWGLSLLLGGAYSNTYDRLSRHYVVDYVSFPVKNRFLRNIIFNISDFCILVGAMLCVAGCDK